MPHQTDIKVALPKIIFLLKVYTGEEGLATVVKQKKSLIHVNLTNTEEISFVHFFVIFTLMSVSIWLQVRIQGGGPRGPGPPLDPRF